MGIILPESKENEILKLLRQDDARHLQEYIERNQLPRDLLYTSHKRTLIQLSCYYESPRCLAKLIEMNHDYNQAENSTGDTPLFICAKFNNLEMVKILLEKSDCNNLIKNYENLNEFDIAFLKGNYNICYYLMYVYKKESNGNNNIYSDNENKNDIKNEKNNNKVVFINKSKGKKEKNEINESSSASSAYDINQVYQKYFYNTDFEYDYFLTLQSQNKYPLFNMPLFFKCLCNKTLPSKCPSFAPPHKKTEDLINKIPDPNETWGHFFKRVTTMELYNPPLVDKKNVSVMNSMYMNAQMKLMENEYGIKMGFYKTGSENGKTDDDETKHPIDMEEPDIIQVKKNRKQIKLKERNNSNDNIDNEIKEKEINIDNINIDDTKNDNDNENNIDNIDRDNEGNLCIIKINENSSQRNVNEKDKDE